MSDAAADPKRASLVADLRARLAARPDTEHEQGILRLVISSLVFLYLLPDALLKHDTLPLYVMGIHLVLALIIFLRIAYSTTISPARRVFAQLADVAAISWYMAVFGEPAGWLFLLYIWVTLGSGFRFGARYLISELAMSVVGFGIVLYVNDFWREHRTFERSIADLPPDAPTWTFYEGPPTTNGMPIFALFNDKGELVPMDLADGDEIIFSKYGGTEIKLGTDEVLILRESDVLAKVVGTRSKTTKKKELAGTAA